MRAPVFFMAMAVCFSPPVHAQTESPEPDQAIAAPLEMATTPTTATTFKLSKVMLDTKTRPLQGKVKGGTMCVFPSKIDIPGEIKTEDYERFDALFSETMRERNFAIITTSQDLFAGASDDQKADYLVGATMRPDTLNICSSISGFKGSLLLDVEWQIFDQAKRQVVETITTTAQAEIPKFDTNGFTLLWNNAFTDNLAALIERGVIAKYAGGVPEDGVAEVKASSSTD